MNLDEHLLPRVHLISRLSLHEILNVSITYTSMNLFLFFAFRNILANEEVN